MTSIYLGSDQTEYILDSGKKIVLSIEEFNELYGPTIDEYDRLADTLAAIEASLEEAEEELSTYFNAIETIKKVVDECPI